MPAHKPPPPNEKPRREWFTDTTREMNASENPEDFERVFRRIVSPVKMPPSDVPRIGVPNGSFSTPSNCLY
jgi:hypothetical protein